MRHARSAMRCSVSRMKGELHPIDIPLIFILRTEPCVRRTFLCLDDSVEWIEGTYFLRLLKRGQKKTSLPVRYPLAIAAHAINHTKSADEGTPSETSLEQLTQHASFSCTRSDGLFSEGSLSLVILSFQKHCTRYAQHD